MADQPKLKPPLNFQQHLAELDKAGLLVCIDRPINTQPKGSGLES